MKIPAALALFILLFVQLPEIQAASTHQDPVGLPATPT
mgnify:CR=1 FL=1|jgi:hypothetical protein